MSPALLTKYLDAAKEVARHMVLLPDGVAGCWQHVEGNHDRRSPAYRKRNLELMNQNGRRERNSFVDIIEAGFPIASPDDFDAVHAIAKNVKGPTIAALARTMEKDIAQAGQAIAPALKRQRSFRCARRSKKPA